MKINQEKLYYSIYFIWGLVTCLQQTLSTPIFSTNIIRFFNLTIILILLFLLFYELLTKRNNRMTSYQFMFCIVFLVFWFYISKNNFGLSFATISLFIVVGGIYNFSKLLKIYISYAVIILVCVIGLNKLNILPSNFVVSFGRIRDSLGFFYPSFPAQIIFFIICAIVMYKKYNLRYIYIFLLELINIYIYISTNTKSPFILSSILLIYLFTLKLFHIKKFITKHLSLKIIGSSAFPLCLLFLLWLILKAPAPIFSFINHAISGRLQLSLNGLNEFGIKMLGQKVSFTLYDAWGNLSPNYNYIDSAYLQNLIINGWLFTILLLVLFTIINIKYAKANNEIGVGVMVIIALQATFDPQWLWLWYSPFVLVLGQLFWSTKINNLRFNK